MRVVQTLCRWDRAVYPSWIHPDKLLIDIGGLRPHSQLLTTGCCPPSRPSWTRNTFTLVFYRITKSTAQYISVAEYHNTFTTQDCHKYQPQSGYVDIFTTKVCVCSFDGDGICKSTKQCKSRLPYIFHYCETEWFQGSCIWEETKCTLGAFIQNTHSASAILASHLNKNYQCSIVSQDAL